MKYTYIIAFALVIVLIFIVFPSKQAPVVEEKLGLLESAVAGKSQVIDLTHPLNERNAYWPGEGYHPFKYEVIATLETDGAYSGKYSTPEHLGTHIDAPNHFEADQPSVDQLPLEQLVGPAVIIDVHSRLTASSEYMLSVDDITNWEAQNGPIPEGAIVIMRSGWGYRWESDYRYKNADASGTLHFPGFSKEAAVFLTEERDIKGVGVDTMSVDSGSSKDFAAHHTLCSKGKWVLENLGNLEKLPARGMTLIVAPIKIDGGSGGQARVWAILP